MTSYTFDELTRRAQANAISSYYSDPAVLDLINRNRRQNERVAEGSEDVYLVYLTEDALSLLPWRFTEHGERVA